MANHWWGTIAFGGFFAVDIFFFITGFLLTYFLLIELDKNHGKIKWSLLYLHRIIRIMPTYLFMLGFCYWIIPYLGSGPLWDIKQNELNKDCTDY